MIITDVEIFVFLDNFLSLRIASIARRYIVEELNSVNFVVHKIRFR